MFPVIFVTLFSLSYSYMGETLKLPTRVDAAREVTCNFVEPDVLVLRVSRSYTWLYFLICLLYFLYYCQSIVNTQPVFTIIHLQIKPQFPKTPTRLNLPSADRENIICLLDCTVHPRPSWPSWPTIQHVNSTCRKFQIMNIPSWQTAAQKIILHHQY